MVDEIPEWLNEDFLVKALQGGEDKEPRVAIVDFKVAPADVLNFSSDIFRITVHFRVGESSQEQSKNLIVKNTDDTALLQALLGPSIWEKEKVYYRDLLPLMMDKVQCRFAPESYYCALERVYIMEDLSKDYVLLDSNKQLDFEHYKMSIATLAKFHASSVAVYHEKPGLIEFVGREFFFPEGGGPLKEWIETGVKTYGETLSKSEDEEFKEYSDFFLSRVDKLWDTVVKTVKPRPNRLNVLNHGDMWTANIMFKYNEAKELVDCKFIDYQSSRYTTPTADLVYFMYTSGQHDVREHRQKELFLHYLEVLNDTLERIGCSERFTVEQLKEDLEYMVPWFVAVSPFAFALVAAGAGEDAQDFSGFTSADFIAGKANHLVRKLCQGKTISYRIPNYVRQYFSLLKSFD
uniref:CHK kinase-like domain-containing protein n=1 Tax=Graphocephala atropunctata TaxID=36148 RepID=A0A1B6L845_9HEMI